MGSCVEGKVIADLRPNSAKATMTRVSGLEIKVCYSIPT